MINIGYKTTKDYTGLNPPKFVDIKKIYNTILIPKSELESCPQPADSITLLINNKTIKQKIGIDSGLVALYDKIYYYFHIVPGLPVDELKKNKYEIFIENKKIKLQNLFDSTYNAKIINGLLVLPNNFNYIFKDINLGVISANNKNLLTNILKYDNKYSYYMANTNNTILSILDNKNINSIYEINNTYNDIYIRPLFNKKYPLGSCSIWSEGVSNIRFRNNIFRFNKYTNIDYLPSGNYRIDFLDNNGNPITIDSINNLPWNKTFFDFKINKVSNLKNTRSNIIGFNTQEQPQINRANLLVNIFPHNTSFEIFGPNNFYKKFNTGYQKLFNIIPGIYNIKYKDNNKEILIIKNDNNYFSNL